MPDKIKKQTFFKSSIPAEAESTLHSDQKPVEDPGFLIGASRICLFYAIKPIKKRDSFVMLLDE